MFHGLLMFCLNINNYIRIAFSFGFGSSSVSRFVVAPVPFLFVYVQHAAVVPVSGIDLPRREWAKSSYGIGACGCVRYPV